MTKSSIQQKNERAVSIAIATLLVAVGVMMILMYFVRFNFSLFIGIGLIVVGALTAHRSVISEMTFKKYSGPDVMSGLAIVALGVTLLSEAMLGVIFGAFPLLACIIGLWLILDGTLALIVHKSRNFARLILGIAYMTLGIVLFSLQVFGTVNCILLGASVLTYDVFFIYKEFVSKDKDIEVIKIQEDYE